MAKYRIKWWSLLTGVKGEGKPVFTSASEANKSAKELNKRHPGLVHYVVPAIEQKKENKK